MLQVRLRQGAGNAGLSPFPCAEIKYGIAARCLQFPQGKAAQKSPRNSPSDTFGCQCEMQSWIWTGLKLSERTDRVCSEEISSVTLRFAAQQRPGLQI